ncbi:hypothetical protein GCM10009840_18350 [Pseudolysinimonas kribbensis]
MRPAIASEAPRLWETTGMIGRIAPSPVENSVLGRTATRITALHRNRDSGELLIALVTLRATRGSSGQGL